MRKINKYQNGASYKNRARRLRAKLQKKYMTVYTAWVLGVPIELYGGGNDKWTEEEPYTPGRYDYLIDILFDDENKAELADKTVYGCLCRMYCFVDPVTKRRYRIKGEG